MTRPLFVTIAASAALAGLALCARTPAARAGASAAAAAVNTAVTAMGSGTGRVKVPVTLVSGAGAGKAVGTITLRENRSGVLMQLKVTGLPPGQHGFHLHEKGSCAPAEQAGKVGAAVAAGGHYDPAGTGSHKGPGGAGHKGDLPRLEVSATGEASGTVSAPGLRIADFAGRALVIHAGGDNYADAPVPAGGGGERIACGVVPAAK